MSETQRLTELDFAHVWHPFTPMRQWRESQPLIIERGDGFELIDTDGNRYIDGFSSLWCNVHGHRVPEIDRAVREQLDRLAHATMLGYATVPAIEFAARLVERIGSGNTSPAPRVNKVFYSDSGATSTELGFKMAVGHHFHRGESQRNIFVALSGAYHGDTTGAMSVGYSEPFHTPYRRLTFECAWTPAPNVVERDAPTSDRTEWPSWDCERRERVRDWALEELDRVLDAVGDRCAGVVIEPVFQGAGGIVEQPHGFLRGLAERVRRRGLLLIADEVAVGFGRTGTFLACESEGVQPDIVCLGKGISGGYLPLAATLCTDEIAGSFEGEYGEHRTLYHGHTYTGNPLACAAALASLDLIDRNDVVANAVRIGETIAPRLRAGLGDHPNVGDVRSRGTMAGVQLVASRDPWTPLDLSRRLPHQLCAAALARGLIVRPIGDVVILNPAPAMDQGTLEHMLEAFIETVRSFDFHAAGR